MNILPLHKELTKTQKEQIVSSTIRAETLAQSFHVSVEAINQVRKEYRDTFEEFWWNYPRERRIDRAASKIMWQAITGDGFPTKMRNRETNALMDVFLQATPSEILEGLRGYAKSVEKTEAKFICHPTTFLNRGRWEDWL